MELTPQGIRDVEFREKLRGYHPDDVDAFVERVATGVEELLQRLHVAEGGATRTAIAGDDGEVSEETIRRTLLMAQRTADMVLAEAQDAAARNVTEAQESASRIVADAQAEAETMLNEATSGAQAMAQEAIDRLQEEIARLEIARAALQDDIDELWVHSDTQRTKFRELLVQQLDLLDTGPLVEKRPATGAARPRSDAARATADAGEEQPVIGASATADAPVDAVEDPDRPAVAPVPEPSEPVDLVARGRGLGALVSDADDPFLADLRRAVEDHDDDEHPGVFDLDDDDAWGGAAADLGAEGTDAGDPRSSADSASESGRLGGRLFRRR